MPGYNPKAIHLAQAQLEIMVNSGVARYDGEELETFFKAMHACIGHVIQLGDKLGWNQDKINSFINQSARSIDRKISQKKQIRSSKRKLLK